MELNGSLYQPQQPTTGPYPELTLSDIIFLSYFLQMTAEMTLLHVITTPRWAHVLTLMTNVRANVPREARLITFDPAQGRKVTDIIRLFHPLKQNLI